MPSVISTNSTSDKEPTIHITRRHKFCFVITEVGLFHANERGKVRHEKCLIRIRYPE